MTEKIAELLLILLGSAGLLFVRGLRAHLRKHLSARHPSANCPPVENVRPDAEYSILLLAAGVALVLLPFIDLFLPYLDFADFSFSKELAWAGVITAIASITIFGRAAGDLVRYRERSDPVEFRAGIFRYVRHPFYSALLLWVFVQFMLLQNWLTTFAAAALFIAMYVLRMPRHELRWLERFGHRYLHYMEETGALLPRWKSWRQR